MRWLYARLRLLGLARLRWPQKPHNEGEGGVNSALVISLDFELFWGVCDSQCLRTYGNNVSGEWEAIPKILKLFKNYEIRATWATVGMLMCKGYEQWDSIKPLVMPDYGLPKLSTYNYREMAREYPSLFFGRPLVEEILATPGQEVGGHSYSHFYTAEAGATKEQFSSDLLCAEYIADELQLKLESFVFPRNQYNKEFVEELSVRRYKTFRGNNENWLYRDGHSVRGAGFGRGTRLLDQYIPISGSLSSSASTVSSVLNIPASCFFRPYNPRLSALDSLRLDRIKKGMRAAAKFGEIFHLWWHPHNFGINTEKNLYLLTELLRYYAFLKSEYGMKSMAMRDFVRAHE